MKTSLDKIKQDLVDISFFFLAQCKIMLKNFTKKYLSNINVFIICHYVHMGIPPKNQPPYSKKTLTVW